VRPQPSALLLCLWIACSPLAAAGQPLPAAAGETKADGSPEKTKKKKKRKKRRGRRPRQRLDLQTRLWGGGGLMLGQGVRDDRAGLGEVKAELEPELRLGDLSLSTPLDLEHRETFGAELRESSGQARLRAGWRALRELRLKLGAGIAGVLRPGWPDLYQPLPEGGFLPTDRFSYWTRQAGGGLSILPARRNWIRASYEYTLADYATDPAFDAYNEPMHLTPRDHERHDLALGYRYAGRTLRLGAGADAFFRNGFFYFARDAHTGHTHAAPGGSPPNPLEQLRGIEPMVEAQLRFLDRRLRLRVRYGHEWQQDVFQGYYSFQGPRPLLEARYRPVRPLELRARSELWWRRYGENSYRQGPGHPPFTFGDRRQDRKLSASLGARLALTRVFALTLDAAFLWRETNFPPYRPGIFPASRLYDIDWSYTNFSALAGVEIATSHELWSGHE
jgi:hypothetical protein